MTDEPVTQLADSDQRPARQGERRRRRWIVPTITGILALLLGLAVGGNGEEQANQLRLLESELADTQAQLYVAESQASELSGDLQATERTLAESVTVLDEREDELDDQLVEIEKKQADLDDRESTLDDRAAELDDRESELDDWSAELDVREATVEQQAKTGESAGGSSGTTSSSSGSTNVYYKNCDAVRAAGAAPIRRGEPGYASHLDRDNDGVGCE